MVKNEKYRAQALLKRPIEQIQNYENASFSGSIWSFFFLEKYFFGKSVFALCIALLHHNKYEENRYKADIKKSWKIMEFHPKILQNFIISKIYLCLNWSPTKIDLQYKKPIQIMSNWARNLKNMEIYKDYGSVTKFCFLRQLRQNFLYSEDMNKIPG